MSNDGCLAGYTDKADGSAANTVTLAGDCKYCLAANALNAISAAATKCVAKTIANNDGCLAGYTDKSDGAAANTGTLAGDCKYCVASTHALNAKSGAATKCVAKTVVAGGLCLTGYTDKSDGSAATAVGGTLAGDCKYCASGYVENASAGTCVLASSPQTPTPSSSSMIVFSVMLLALIISVLCWDMIQLNILSKMMVENYD